MKKRFISDKKPDENGEVWVFDLVSGAGILKIEPNHDWFWVDKEVDPNWNEQEYVLTIAKVITDALNGSMIPKPNI